MPRLFVTPRELDFISDITKEVIKDLVGQVIHYYQISETKTNVHDVYNESPEKIFERPIKLESLVEYQPENVKTGIFGTEMMFDITAYIHYRDALQRGIIPTEGDFFSYGEIFFEIVKVVVEKNVYGQVEHAVGYQIAGKQARNGQFNANVIGPTDEAYTDPDAVQNTFVQQRGQSENKLGPTADIRDLQRNGVLEPPISGPREVSRAGQGDTPNSAFYDE